MADVAPIEISKSKKSPKPKEKKVPRKSNTKVNHPSTAVMVNSAIETLKERGGSSLHAIKKYIAATYKIDAEKLSPFIKKYLKNSVVSGGLVQTKGIGASGSFKMATTANSKSSTKKSTVAKSKDAKPVTTKKVVLTKKVAKPKKVVKKPAAKKASKPKSPTKAKTTNKVPTKKPKSPKPKVIKPAKKVSPRKK